VVSSRPLEPARTCEPGLDAAADTDSSSWTLWSLAIERSAGEFSSSTAVSSTIFPADHDGKQRLRNDQPCVDRYFKPQLNQLINQLFGI